MQTTSFAQSSASGQAGEFAQRSRGAHVTAWQPAGEAHPVLFSSSLATQSDTVAWRGGIPICAPWFAGGPSGDHTPSHGPARTAEWEELAAAPGATHHRLLVDEDAHGELAALEFSFETERDDESLTATFSVRNIGDTDAVVEAALHSYFAVSDVTAIEVEGLEEAPFFDKVRGADVEPEADIAFGGLVDRIYEAEDSPIVIRDEGWERSLRIERTGSPQAVVWNCGPDAAPGDLGEGEWRGFLCVEAAILGESAPTLAPGERHVLTSTVTVRPMPADD